MWRADLIAEYKHSRQLLNDMLKNLGETTKDNEDRKAINSMIRDVGYTIRWLVAGHEPYPIRPLERRSMYQNTVFIEDMALYFPDEEQEQEKPLANEDKKAIVDVLMLFSEREKQCYVLYNAYGLTMKAIGKEIGVTESSVKTFLTRADQKIKDKFNKEVA